LKLKFAVTRLSICMTPNQEIRVIVVDDDPFVRSALRMLVEDADGFQYVAEAGNGAAALEQIRTNPVDVVLSDLEMPVMGGLEFLRALRGMRSPPVAVVLSNHVTEDSVLAALQAGATGYIDKSADPAVVLDAVRQAAAGESLLSAAVTRNVITRLKGLAPQTQQGRDWTSDLTAREEEIARSVASGLTNDQIAERFTITLSTVKTNVSRILSKLQITNRVQIALVVHGIEV
jgi:DNA-binding NarL/FixJ family response regulator